jgi:ubiquinone/menaquinone biosynthesis C-methylase UbiE
MMFLSDIQKGFNEVSRVLKPGGKFIFNTWNAAENIPVIDAVFNKVLRPFLPIETYRQLLIPFSIYDSQKIIEYMNAASFKNVVVNNVSLISSSSSAKEIVNGLLLKHPLGKKIAQKNALLLSKIANQMEHEIGEQFGYDPAFCQLSAFVIEGEKPGLI